MKKVCRDGWVQKIDGFGEMSNNLPAPMDQGPQLASTPAKEEAVPEKNSTTLDLSKREGVGERKVEAEREFREE